MLVLNQAHEVTGYKLISSGSQCASLIDSKVVFRNALLLGARSIIVAHNHPGGSRTASAPDVAVTRKLVQAGAIVDIPVVDHIIYTSKGYTSIREAMPHLFETPDRTQP